MNPTGGLEVDGTGAVRTAGFDVLPDLGEEMIIGLWVGLGLQTVDEYCQWFEGGFSRTHEVGGELSCEVRADGLAVLIQVGRPDPVQMIPRVPLDVSENIGKSTLSASRSCR